MACCYPAAVAVNRKIEKITVKSAGSPVWQECWPDATQPAHSGKIIRGVKDRSKWPQRVLAVGLALLGLSSASPAGAMSPSCPAYDHLRPLLNSERIQSCFGSYGVEVLEQQGTLRISSLYSLEGEHRISRTLAISEFASDLPESLHEVYQSIRAGASMGSTLEAAGWRVDKRHRYIGEVPISDHFRCMSGFPADYSRQVLAVQVYDLWVLRDDAEVRFALLVELHDPRYLSLPDLQQIYDGWVGQPPAADDASLLVLQRAARFCASR